MIKNYLEKLSPFSLNDKSDLAPSVQFEKFFPIWYLELIKPYNGRIFFKKGAVFSPLINPPIIDKDISIDFLYGNSNGEGGLNHNIKNSFNAIQNELFLSFGECPGGDKVCIEKTTGAVYYFWHDALTDDSRLFHLSDSLEDFIEQLHPEDDEEKVDSKTRGTPSKKLLDFIKKSKLKEHLE